MRLESTPIAGLITTFDAEQGTIPIHGVPLSSIREQAQSLNLPMLEVGLPGYCPNPVYVDRFTKACRLAGVDTVVFGDLFLREVRQFREQSFPLLDLMFPLWGSDTAVLAQEMLAGGVAATITAVNPEVLPVTLIGCPFDQRFLQSLPPTIDPCGENGEFHTLVAPSCLALLA